MVSCGQPTLRLKRSILILSLMSLGRYQSAELINGRTAMTAVAGILIPSVLTHAGLIDLPAWYEAGKVNDANNGWDYRALLFVQFALSHFVEIKRFQDLKNPGSQVRGAAHAALSEI